MLVKTLFTALTKMAHIEYAIDGGWKCWKLPCGIAFCTRRINDTMGTDAAAIMGGYYSKVNLNYPQNFFLENPICFANGRLGSGLGYCHVSSISKDDLMVYVFGNQAQRITLLELFAIGIYGVGLS